MFISKQLCYILDTYFIPHERRTRICRASEEPHRAGEHQERESHLYSFLKSIHFFLYLYVLRKVFPSGMTAVIEECPPYWLEGLKAG